MSQFTKNRVEQRRWEHWHKIVIWLVVYDIAAMNLAYLAGLWLRFDCRFTTIPAPYIDAYLKYIPIHTITTLIIFISMRLYKSLWRFASYNELVLTAAASVVSFALHSVGITVLYCRMPISYYLFGFMIQFVLVLAARFSYRFILLERRRWQSANEEKQPETRVMLVGAGSAGQMILRDLLQHAEYNEMVYCIIDDNPNKWNRYIENVPIVGGRDDILLNVQKYKIDKIYIAIPSCPPEDLREILNICNETSCELKNLPSIHEYLNGMTVNLSNMKDVSVEDLLGRDPIKTNLTEVFEYVSGKCILVTGGGGSIGSELCRQVAAHAPKHLIIFDMYENNAYDVEQELKRKYSNLKLTVLIGSVRDSRRIQSVMAEYKPDIVYHAAAHKHVPLMETSPCEAIKNNAIGTYKIAYAALMNGCKKFVLISTDKAVNPTNIMGASKRLCEMVIQTLDKAVKEGTVDQLPELHAHHEDEDGSIWKIRLQDKPCTEYVAVRFGNVLGSNGSVIPLFKKQIAAGGPVTVTHPDIIRYFMTIPEAVSLVLQAGTYAKGGEIFVLDMGEPVKIDTLARNLIKLSGYTPDVDMQVVYTGLRPGEKLYEEKLMEEEGMKKTPNELIHIGSPIPFDNLWFLEQMQKLMEAAYENDRVVVKLVEEMVPTYHPVQNEN